MREVGDEAKAIQLRALQPFNYLSSTYPQAHGSRLRLHQMSTADSGEYVCRANNNIDAQETSLMVTVSPSAGRPSGEWTKATKGQGDPMNSAAGGEGALE